MKIKPVVKKRPGVPVMFYMAKEFKEDLKLIGAGCVAAGLRQVLIAYEKEIRQTAESLRKAS